MAIGKASRQYGTPKLTLSDKINNKWETNKEGRAAELTEVEEKGLKFYIDYMASINHPLTISALKCLRGVLSKAVNALIDLIHQLVQEILGT